MENVRSHEQDWRSQPPLNYCQKTEQLHSTRTNLQEDAITPEQALEEASFTFNQLTGYDDMTLDSRVVWAANIQQFQAASDIFDTIATRSGGETMISFAPEASEQHETEYTSKYLSMNVSEYAKLLYQSAEGQLAEKFESFSGKSSVIHNHESPPNYEDSLALSALLYEDQWHTFNLQHSPDKPLSSIHDMPKGDFPIDIAPIALLCKAQTKLSAALSEHHKYADKETLRIKLNEIHDTLESPQLSSENIDTLHATATVKHLLHATVIQELAELSLDGNPDDFTKLRKDCPVFAVDEVQEAPEELTRKSIYSVNLALAATELRSAEAILDTASTQTTANLTNLSNRIRYRYDVCATKAGFDKVEFSGAKLADMPTPELASYIETVSEEIGALAVEQTESVTSSTK